MSAYGLLVVALASCAGLRSRPTDLDCPDHTRLELTDRTQGTEAHCVLGDGTRHGPWGGWYPSGQRAIAGDYDKGELHGVENEWYFIEALEGRARTRAKFVAPRRSRTDWSRGKRHGEWVEWDIDGDVLQRSTWHRGEFVEFEHPKGSEARDAELGRPFATARKPSGCFDRQFFPSVLNRMMGEPTETQSGLEVLFGTNVSCRPATTACRNFSRAELGDVMGHEIEGYTESARFAVRSCATREDDELRMAAEEAAWRARSAADLDPGVMAFVREIEGVWCGRSTRISNGVESHREVRIAFIPGDPDGAAQATDTWSRTPGGPVGGPGYVMRSLLIPRPRKAPASNGPQDSAWRSDIPSQVAFKPVSVHANSGSFTLERRAGSLLLRHGRAMYPMSQSCETFWAPPGPDPSKPTVEGGDAP